MSEVTSTNALVKDSTMQTLNSKLDTLNTTLGGNTNIAPVFNTATAYTKGDMVYYNNDLYVFTSNHSAGAWTGNDVVQTKVSTEISSLKSGLTNIESAVDVSNATLSFNRDISGNVYTANILLGDAGDIMVINDKKSGSSVVASMRLFLDVNNKRLQVGYYDGTNWQYYTIKQFT